MSRAPGSVNVQTERQGEVKAESCKVEFHKAWQGEGTDEGVGKRQSQGSIWLVLGLACGEENAG